MKHLGQNESAVLHFIDYWKTHLTNGSNYTIIITVGSRNQNLCLQEVKKSQLFWHLFYLLAHFPSVPLFPFCHSPCSGILSSLVQSSPLLRSLSSSRWLQSAPLPCSLLLTNPILRCDRSLSLLQSMWVLWFHFGTTRSLFSESKRTEGTDKEERGRHLFIVQSVAVANSLDLRRRDWLLNRMIYTTALVSVSWIWRSQLRLWVNVQLAPCGCLKWI